MAWHKVAGELLQKCSANLVSEKKKDRSYAARDVMTKAVVTVKPETPMGKIAALLLENAISGVPVVDETGAVIGIVTEGDLLKLNAPDREQRREWWLTLLAEGEGLAKEFLSTISNNQRTAREIMSAPVVTVTDDTGHR